MKCAITVNRLRRSLLGGQIEKTAKNGNILQRSGRVKAVQNVGGDAVSALRHMKIWRNIY